MQTRKKWKNLLFLPIKTPFDPKLWESNLFIDPFEWESFSFANK